MVHSPITCTKTDLLRGRLSKSRRTTCCHVPRQSFSFDDRDPERRLHERGPHVRKTVSVAPSQIVGVFDVRGRHPFQAFFRSLTAPGSNSMVVTAAVETRHHHSRKSVFGRPIRARALSNVPVISWQSENPLGAQTDCRLMDDHCISHSGGTFVESTP